MEGILFEPTSRFLRQGMNDSLRSGRTKAFPEVREGMISILGMIAQRRHQQSIVACSNLTFRKMCNGCRKLLLLMTLQNSLSTTLD